MNSVKKPQLPIPTMRYRERSQSVFDLCMGKMGLGFIESVIVGNRVVEPSLSAINDILDPAIDGSRFSLLKDVDKAADRIIAAKLGKERIGLVTDFDVDGITSAVVMYRALTEILGFDEQDVKPFINNRMLFGYGFNEIALQNLMEKAGDEVPSLLITADQGSNDTAQIAEFKRLMAQRGLSHADVIVTDHHDINDGNRCEDAIAFINPQRPDCEFGDPTICGCVVALCLMRVTRDRMIQQGLLPEDTPRLNHLMTYAGLATVADCVSLQSPWNRKIIRSCTRDMNDPRSIPAWQVLKNQPKQLGKKITTTTLGFLLGPLINADSRTGGDGMDAFRFLTASSYEDAQLYYDRLTSKNERRKEVNAAMLEDAVVQASEQYYGQGRRGLVVYLPQGSHGIHGIVASRIKDLFHCPTLVFSPNNVDDPVGEQQLITGSGRSIEGFNIIQAVRRIAASTPAMADRALKRGGHAMAMGMKLFLHMLPGFHDAFDAAVKQQANLRFYPVVQIDHLLQGDTLKIINDPRREAVDFVLGQISRLEPYGQRFESPLFAMNGVLVDLRPLGASATSDHAKIRFRDTEGVEHEAVVFNISQHIAWFERLVIGNAYTFAVEMSLNTYNNAYNIGFQLKIALQGMNAVSHTPREE